MLSAIKKLKMVSVIIPCRDEREYIKECLDSVIANDFPKSKLEVLIIDGMSNDGTREIINGYVKNYPYIKLLDNPEKITPTALNTGIKKSRGQVIIRIDAHAVYPGDYISKCVAALLENDVDNAGGICVTRPADDSSISRSIAAALSNPFGVGNSYFRIGSSSPRLVDTVPFGCYKIEVFDKIGLFDEDLIRNQDDEFNARLIKNGGKILLIPDIVSYYYARNSFLKLWRMYYQYGIFKPLAAKKSGGIVTVRQLTPALFISIFIISGLLSFFSSLINIFFMIISCLYFGLNFLISIFLSLKKKNIKLALFLPVSFSILHFSYGAGYIKGVWDYIIRKKHLRGNSDNIKLSR